MLSWRLAFHALCYTVVVGPTCVNRCFNRSATSWTPVVNCGLKNMFRRLVDNQPVQTMCGSRNYLAILM